MNYAIGDVYILLEDLDMCNDNYGFRTGGGTAKAGQRFELLDLPDRKKKKYTLLSLDVKFPYHLYLRENDFERLFTKVAFVEYVNRHTGQKGTRRILLRYKGKNDACQVDILNAENVLRED